MIMGNYDDLIDFLNGLDDFFIEVEGKTENLNKFIASYNSEMNENITMYTDGVCKLDDYVDKWGLEFRLYTNERPRPRLGNRFHKNRLIHHAEYEYRLSDNELVRPLLYDGFRLGRN